MQIALPQLPHPSDTLAPRISRTTLEIHHGKHHRGYVRKAGTLAKEVRLDDSPLERIGIKQIAGGKRHCALFNTAAPAWNHAFFWRSLTPKGGGAPECETSRRIDTDRGGCRTFAKRFGEAAAWQFDAAPRELRNPSSNIPLYDWQRVAGLALIPATVPPHAGS